MGFYSERILPRGMEFMMSMKDLAAHRRKTLAGAQGEVLEIGLGSGLNLPHYPQEVKKITAIDVNPGMNALAQRRAQKTGIQVKIQTLSGEKLPMPERTFDSVVSTWTLCSIENLPQALEEIHRVLKPEGKFFFVEHGLSDQPKVQRWQHFLNPILKKPLGGCNMNRDIEGFIRRSGFRFLELEKFYMDKRPKVSGYTYQGVASPGSP